MKAFAIACTIALCAISNALSQAWVVNGLNHNTRTIVPDSAGNVVLVSDNNLSKISTQTEIGWQKISPSTGAVLASYNFASSPNEYLAAGAAVCGNYLGVIAYYNNYSDLAVLIFPLTGGAPKMIQIASNTNHGAASIRATSNAFYACYNTTTPGHSVVDRISVTDVISWTASSTANGGGTFQVPIDSMGNAWPETLGTATSGADIATVFNASQGILSGESTLSYQPGYVAAPTGYADSCLDATGAYTFALGSAAYVYPNNRSELEYMPNVQVYPYAQASPIGYGTYNFPVENTPYNGVFGLGIASRPVTTSSLAVYGVVSGDVTHYDSFATIWNPALSLLAITPTVYLHSNSSPPTLVAADPTHVYFAGGGTIYEHVASTFALSTSLTASGSTDLLATAGRIFLVGADSVTCYSP